MRCLRSKFELLCLREVGRVYLTSDWRSNELLEVMHHRGITSVTWDTIVIHSNFVSRFLNIRLLDKRCRLRWVHKKSSKWAADHECFLFTLLSYIERFSVLHWLKNSCSVLQRLNMVWTNYEFSKSWEQDCFDLNPKLLWGKVGLIHFRQ